MTRTTSFGFGKRQYVASTAEEHADRGQGDFAPAASPPPPSKKNGRKGGEDDVNAEAGPSMGWGKDPEIIRKAQRSEERRLARQNTKHSGTTCFACRSKGHAAKDCPNVLLSSSASDLPPVKGNEASEDAANDGKRKAADEGQGKGFKRAKGKKGADVAGTSGRCYRCNSTQHPLSRCARPVSDGLPYATCFICLQTGHLASTCSSNARGVYPNGGSCKVCGSVQHRASDCPEDKRRKKLSLQEVGQLQVLERGLSGKAGEWVVGSGDGVGADEDDFMAVKRKVQEVERQKRPEKKKVEKKQVRKEEGEQKVNPILEELERAEKVVVERQQPAIVTQVQAPSVVPPVKRKPKVVKF